MVYLKLILYDRKFKQDDIYPISVRIIYNRKTTTISSGVRIEGKYWDYASGSIINTHPNYMLLNTKLSEFYLKVQKAILNLENTASFSIEELRQELSNNKPVNKINSSTSGEQHLARSGYNSRLPPISGNSSLKPASVNFCKTACLSSFIGGNVS
ncbi:hypothetical protein FW774_01750 (plasmid) [Pedobacter sp. BS3]|uniref:Arm DNA-binding domain-containing protein n=1 Tax=Pedobacter sp. BS3 TaxID=2567937 RepID=UPI0011EFF481|nr:hypothetical protein FW774_01750 [Pedobacter sp. BS3]